GAGGRSARLRGGPRGAVRDPSTSREPRWHDLGACATGGGVDRTTLVLLSDLNYAEANRELTRRAGRTVLEEEGLVGWAGAHARRVLVNGCMRTTDALAPADVLARARRFFAPRRRGFSVVLRGDRDADLAPACDEAGMARMDDTRGMVLARRL